MKGNVGDRSVTLRFLGEGFAGGEVPISILAAKLEALQRLVFHAAATVADDRIARRGQWTNRYREWAELVFLGSHSSDLEIQARLPAQRALADRLDLGTKAVDLVLDVASAVEANTPDRVRALVPDSQARAFILRGIEGMCPAAGDDYRIVLGNGRPRATFAGQTRDNARNMATSCEPKPPADQEETTIVGTLTKIHVEVGPPLVAVKVSSGNEIKCFYDESLRDQVANLVAGSLVEVNGVASRDSLGNVFQLDTVFDVAQVDTEPVRIARFEHDGRIHRLSEPLLFNVEFVNGLWVYSNEDTNLWGTGTRREDAIRDLAENFDYLLHELGEEDARALDAPARDVREILRRITAESGASNAT